jgi:hypothetical protein
MIFINMNLNCDLIFPAKTNKRMSVEHNQDNPELIVTRECDWRNDGKILWSTFRIPAFVTSQIMWTFILKNRSVNHLTVPD